MHNAFLLSPLLDSIPLPVSAILIAPHGDRLFVGSASGSLLVYELIESWDVSSGQSPNAKNLPPSISLVETKRNLFRKSIDSLSIIKELNTLVILADSYIHLYDLTTLEKQAQISETKGASLFTTNTSIETDSDGIPAVVTSLAVVIKRKLSVFCWRDAQFVGSKDFSLPHTPKALLMDSNSAVVIGFLKNTVVMTLPDGNTVDLHDWMGSTSSIASMGLGKPQAKVSLANAGMDVISAMDSTTITLPMALSLGQSDSESPQKSKQDWTSAIENLIYSPPYVLTLLTTKPVEIRHYPTYHLVQTLDIPNAKFISVGKHVYVANSSTVWRLSPVPVEDQFKQLVSLKDYDVALAIIQSLNTMSDEEKVDQIARIRKLQAYNLFETKQYDTAMSIFQELCVHPSVVTSMFSSLRTTVVEMDDNDIETDIKIVNADHDNPDSRRSLIRFLTERRVILQRVRQELTQTSHSSLPAPSTSAVPSSTGPSAPSSPLRQPQSSSTTKLNKSNSSLTIPASSPSPPQTRSKRSYSTFSRHSLSSNHSTASSAPSFTSTPSINSFSTFYTQHQPGQINQQIQTMKVKMGMNMEQVEKQLEYVDNLLLKLYLKTSDTMVGSLLRVTNWCNVEETEKVLVEYKKYHELIDLLYGKGLHRKALELLVKFGKDIKNPLYGYTHVISYLHRLHSTDADLILEFAGWVVKGNKEEGMKFFITDALENHILPREKVISHLSSISKRLLIQYLEFLLDEVFRSYPPSARSSPTSSIPCHSLTNHASASGTPGEITDRNENMGIADEEKSIHLLLIDCYIEEVLKELKRSGARVTPVDEEDEGTEVSVDEESEGGKSDTDNDDRNSAVEENGDLSSTRRKLIQFLQFSQYYSPEEILKKLPHEDLYEEQAILHSKLHRHKEALSIYIHKLRDFRSAEEYCNAHYSPTNPQTKDIYFILFRVYLESWDIVHPTISTSSASTQPSRSKARSKSRTRDKPNEPSRTQKSESQKSKSKSKSQKKKGTKNIPVLVDYGELEIEDSEDVVPPGKGIVDRKGTEKSNDHQNQHAKENGKESEGEGNAKDEQDKITEDNLESDATWLYKWQAMVSLLTKHAEKYDTLQVLDLLPPKLPLYLLIPFFEKSFQNLMKERHEQIILKSLGKSDNFVTKDILQQFETKVTYVDDYTMCPVCTKRIGQSVFAVYPNGVVVHYGCSIR
ncbi:hypothetical protein BKA69DRAFT_1059179 [Paraphysoderma sedebokerense]|nr:hypothetical protein BKA69DRAFT_1059179 [Paraphysoderma sedebokerense]